MGTDYPEARKELRAYFTSSLGIGAQKYEPQVRGEERDAVAQMMWGRRQVQEVKDVSRFEATLYAVPTAMRMVLRAWGSPKQPRSRSCMCPKPKPQQAREMRCRHERLTIILGELQFIAPLTATAIGFNSDTEDALEKLSKERLELVAVEASTLLLAALATYDAVRVLRVEQERTDKRARLVKLQAIINDSVPPVSGVFTAEEVETLRSMVPHLYDVDPSDEESVIGEDCHHYHEEVA